MGYDEWPMQWVKGWGGAKKVYCCKTVGRGCPSELPPPSGAPPSGLPAAPDTGPYDRSWIPSVLHVLGEALVHKQVELVLLKEGQGMQEQHTITHVRDVQGWPSMNRHRADPIFRLFKACKGYNFA